MTQIPPYGVTFDDVAEVEVFPIVFSSFKTKLTGTKIIYSLSEMKQQDSAVPFVCPPTIPKFLRPSSEEAVSFCNANIKKNRPKSTQTKDKSRDITRSTMGINVNSSSSSNSQRSKKSSKESASYSKALEKQMEAERKERYRKMAEEEGQVSKASSSHRSRNRRDNFRDHDGYGHRDRNKNREKDDGQDISCEPLVIRANRWTPKSLRSSIVDKTTNPVSLDPTTTSNEEAERANIDTYNQRNDILLKSLTSLLNKLSATNREKILVKTIALLQTITNPITLKKAAQLIVSKAANSIKFSESFGLFCQSLMQLNRPSVEETVILDIPELDSDHANLELLLNEYYSKQPPIAEEKLPKDGLIPVFNLTIQAETNPISHSPVKFTYRLIDLITDECFKLLCMEDHVSLQTLSLTLLKEEGTKEQLQDTYIKCLSTYMEGAIKFFASLVKHSVLSPYTIFVFIEILTTNSENVTLDEVTLLCRLLKDTSEIIEQYIKINNSLSIYKTIHDLPHPILRAYNKKYNNIILCDLTTYAQPIVDRLYEKLVTVDMSQIDALEEIKQHVIQIPVIETVSNISQATILCNLHDSFQTYLQCKYNLLLELSQTMKSTSLRHSYSLIDILEFNLSRWK